MLEYPLFHLPRRLLRVFMCWPDDPWTWSRALFVAFTFANHVIQMSFAFKYVFESFENPLETFDALNPSLTELITFLKVCVLLYYRKEFKDNHDIISSYFDKDYTGEQYKIVHNATRSAYRYCLFTFIGGFATNFCFFLRPIANNLVRYIINGNMTRDLPFKASVPFDLNQNPTYQIQYALSSFSGLFTCFGFSGVDSIIMTYCKYLGAQFDIISNQLRTNCGEKIDDDLNLFSKQQNYNFSVKLRGSIKMHIELITRVNELSSIIWPIILSHFISAALGIGLSLVDFIKLHGFATALYLIYASVVLLQLLNYCIGGTVLAEASEGIHRSAYFTHWYRLDSKNRRDLLLMMAISTNGTNLRVPFFTPSLQAYRAILSASLSYVTILQSFF